MSTGYSAYIKYREYAAMIEWEDDDNLYNVEILELYLQYSKKVRASFTSKNLEEASAKAFSVINRLCLECLEQHEQRPESILKMQIAEETKAVKEIQAKMNEY